MRELVDLYFKDNTIVTHHIESFNDFVCAPDNPNSRMQRIVDDIRVPTDDAIRGIIKLDPERNKQRGKELVISTDDSPVKILLIPTDEELMIATDTAALLK